jgi:hypothetical protein
MVTVARKITSRKSVRTVRLNKLTESGESSLAARSITLATRELRSRWKPARLKPGPSIAEMINEERR